MARVESERDVSLFKADSGNSQKKVFSRQVISPFLPPSLAALLGNAFRARVREKRGRKEGRPNFAVSVCAIIRYYIVKEGEAPNHSSDPHFIAHDDDEEAGQKKPGTHNHK